MRPILRVAGTIVLLAISSVSSGFAQEPHGLRDVTPKYRDGFWLAFALGTGNESFRFENDRAGYSNEITAPTFSLRMGGTPSQHWLLGVEFFAWFDGDLSNYFDVNSNTLSSGLVIAQFYPFSRFGLYVKGGVGVAGNFLRTVAPSGLIVTDIESGLATDFGAGFDLRVGRNVSITPTIDVHYQFLNRIEIRERIVSVGVGLTFH
jgi:hypothetical protein